MNTQEEIWQNGGARLTADQIADFIRGVPSVTNDIHVTR